MCTGQRMPWPGKASGCSSLRSGLLPAPLDLVGTDIDHRRDRCCCAQLAACSLPKLAAAQYCGSRGHATSFGATSVGAARRVWRCTAAASPAVDWHAHNTPLVGAGAGGAPFCLSEVVMTVFAVLFRFKWWWMLRTRPGLVSGGQDTFSPLCGVTGEFAGVGDRTAPVATGGRRGRRLHGMDVPAVRGGGRRCARFSGTGRSAPRCRPRFRR